MTADAMTVLARSVVVQLHEALEHGNASGIVAAGRQLDHLLAFSPAQAAVAFKAACRDVETTPVQ